MYLESSALMKILQDCLFSSWYKCFGGERGSSFQRQAWSWRERMTQKRVCDRFQKGVRGWWSWNANWGLHLHSSWGFEVLEVGKQRDKRAWQLAAIYCFGTRYFCFFAATSANIHRSCEYQDNQCTRMSSKNENQLVFFEDFEQNNLAVKKMYHLKHYIKNNTFGLWNTKYQTSPQGDGHEWLWNVCETLLWNSFIKVN